MKGKDDPHCICGPKFNSWKAEDSTNAKGVLPNGMPGNNGWWICSNCGLPSLHAMNECDVCERKFKGLRPGIKIAYTCPECE